MKTIIQGEKSVFTVRLTTKEAGSEISLPYDLTGNTEITMHWKVGTKLKTKNRVATTVGVVVLGDARDGKIQGTLLVADTADMPKTGTGLVEIKVDFGSGNVKKFIVENAFTMKETAAA